MRDVTDNRTGELEGIKVKRGRGRPRKEGALTNAQRQAAYRARRRAETVTVTKSPRLAVGQVDAYDDCRLELEALRAELAEAHETIDELNDELLPLRATNQRLEEEVVDVNRRFVELVNELTEARYQAKNNAAKSVTGNGNPVDFDFMVELVNRVRKARDWKQRHAIADLPGWDRFSRRATGGMRNALWNAMTGDKLPVTPDA